MDPILNMSATNKRNRRRNTRRRRTQRYNNPQMSGAPAGVSQDLQQFTNFYPSSNKKGIRIHTCAAISEVNREDTSAAGGALSQPGGVGVSLQLNLTEPVRLGVGGGASIDQFISPVFDLISSAFVRYKVNRLIFHYEPQSSATNGERLVFAFAEDPVHPVLWNSTVPTTTDLLALADSIAFMPWRGWSMDVSDTLNDTLYYTYADPTTTVSNVTERFSDFGVLSCVGATASQGAVAKCGVLYMEIDFELIEFCPISTTDPASAIALRSLLKKSQKKNSSKPERVDLNLGKGSKEYEGQCKSSHPYLEDAGVKHCPSCLEKL